MSTIRRWTRVMLGPPGRRSGVGMAGAVLLALMVVPCAVTLPWSLDYYAVQDLEGVVTDPRRAPSWSEPMGTDGLGRSMLWRCLLGGAISLTIGGAAAVMSVSIGVAWGSLAGYVGGRVDAAMMRIVDVLYGLPYILLVVLANLALKPVVEGVLGRLMSPDGASGMADVVTLLVAIAGVSWLTPARVIRGQVLSLRAQPFIEAARACGVGGWRIFYAHLLPNLIGPIVVYTTLTVPAAILQESFLSFLGIGVQPPLPSWGNLASEGVAELSSLGVRGTTARWWLLLWPCLLLGLTLLALNFVGESLRDRLDPRRGVT